MTCPLCTLEKRTYVCDVCTKCGAVVKRGVMA